jgi:hypothetical protein
MRFIHRRHHEDALARQQARYEAKLRNRDATIRNLRTLNGVYLTERDEAIGRLRDYVGDDVNARAKGRAS